jgi:hypothetical protein
VNLTATVPAVELLAADELVTTELELLLALVAIELLTAALVAELEAPLLV